MNEPVPWNRRIHRHLGRLLKATLLLGALLSVYQGRYQVTVETLLILAVTMLPILFRQRYALRIPYEFELLAVVFIYASLFLGEVHGYYIRFWWWDLVLHAGAGLLLGILGFVLVYVLNEDDHIDLALTPGFMAMFAFAFAMAFGAVWEIFEFTMDSLFGLTMQKPMFNDASGLTDTMWDLIIDAIGAIIISVFGYVYLRTAENDSFLEKWIDDFIDNNPGLFRPKE